MSKGIIRISDAASIALRSAAYLAAAGESGAKISEIASAIGASKNHLAKVLALLASEGLVHSERGPSGATTMRSATVRNAAISSCIPLAFTPSSFDSNKRGLSFVIYFSINNRR